ncbi:hypothetical protein K2173_008122 [Erythroxylum novogranatense]|uniref:Reverse transcriptase Ty1/copia-type domain-containing protein n=1 Tax=Erythroxylum novogranatense TaxID=1862640 RepID=A0AAV8S920_9ROSI|nr:hypothetical protein K2173_008122 [Erythroxylum novogranatense]
MDQCLQEFGYTRCTLEHVVYKKQKGENVQIVGIYVDDLIITDSKPEEIRNFKEQMKKTDESQPVDVTLYRSVIGSLRYLVNTRPDLAYSVGVASRFMETPTEIHMAAVKQILRYLKGTLSFGCRYSSDKESYKLMGYADSDLAGDVDDRKSTTGVIFFLGENPITWSSQKQKTVALSSCEVEYVAMTVCLSRHLD